MSRARQTSRGLRRAPSARSPTPPAASPAPPLTLHRTSAVSIRPSRNSRLFFHFSAVDGSPNVTPAVGDALRFMRAQDPRTGKELAVQCRRVPIDSLPQEVVLSTKVRRSADCNKARCSDLIGGEGGCRDGCWS